MSKELPKVVGIAGLDLERFAQSLRLAHCANGGADHPCVGTCTITSRGVELTCTKCGNGEEPIAPPPLAFATRVARAVLHAALGGDFDALTPQAQRDAHDAVERLLKERA